MIGGQAFVLENRVEVRSLIGPCMAIGERQIAHRFLVAVSMQIHRPIDGHAGGINKETRGDRAVIGGQISVAGQDAQRRCRAAICRDEVTQV